MCVCVVYISMRYGSLALVLVQGMSHEMTSQVMYSGDYHCSGVNSTHTRDICVYVCVGTNDMACGMKQHHALVNMSYDDGASASKSTLTVNHILC